MMSTSRIILQKLRVLEILLRILRVEFRKSWHLFAALTHAYCLSSQGDPVDVEETGQIVDSLLVLSARGKLYCVTLPATGSAVRFVEEGGRYIVAILPEEPQCGDL